MIHKITNLLGQLMPNVKGFKQAILSLVMVVVTVVVITLIEKYIDHRFQNFGENLQEQVDTLIETSVKAVIDSTELYYSHKVNKAILKYPEIDMKIESLLTNCLTKIGAGKAQVAIFHNGDKTITKDPFLKFTCTNEAIVERRINIDRTADQYQSSSYARIAFYASEINKNGYFIVDNVEEMKGISLPDYQAAKTAFVKSIAFIKMDKPNGEPLGVIAIFSYDRPVEFSRNIDYLEMTADLVAYEVMLKYDAN